MPIVSRLDEATLKDRLSERSIKFYKETQNWDADGFWDQDGVYQRFGDESGVEPPTPYPPSLMSDAGDESHPQVEFSKLLKSESLFQIESSDHTAADPELSMSGRTSVPRKDLFVAHDEANRQRLFGRLEGILIGQYAEAKIGLEKAYQLAGVEYPDEIVRIATGSLEATKSAKKLGVGLNDVVGLGEGGHKDAGVTTKSPGSDGSGMADVSDPPAMSPGPHEVTKVQEEARGSTSLGSIRKAAEVNPDSGRKETSSTPVNAKEGDYSKLFVTPWKASYNSGTGAKKGLIGGDGGDDEDLDENIRGSNSRDDHHASKVKKRKKDEDEDDWDKDNDGHGDGPTSSSKKPNKHPPSANKQSKPNPVDNTKTRRTQSVEDQVADLGQEAGPASSTKLSASKKSSKRGKKGPKEFEIPPERSSARLREKSNK